VTARWVPGEGVEPSRAEAHGFLRPARLPIPPSRPGRPRVAARGIRAGLAWLLFLFVVGCTAGISPSETTRPTIAFLFDGASPDAELVTSPALSGLELAAHEAGGIEIEPVNVGLEREEVTASLRALGDDRGVDAAVVAPWTAPPEGAIELLAAEGLPVITLSWAWGPPPDGEGVWLSFVAGRAREAVILLSGATESAPDDAVICLAGDDDVTSRALLQTAAELGQAAGDPEIVTAGIAETGRAATAEAVAARIPEAGCPVLVWIGGVPAAARVLSGIPDHLSVVGSSRIKTDDGLALASSGVAVSTVCACVDVSLSTHPRWQRFVHDIQAESGAPPGPFSVEAYDAGRLLIGLLEGREGSREDIASALDDITRFRGLAGAYAFEADGSRSSRRMGIWRAAGSRWLPRAATTGAPASPA
jgi:ABC-type branched-subunit amino acid transport system substrate-binding protein